MNFNEFNLQRRACLRSAFLTYATFGIFATMAKSANMIQNVGVAKQSIDHTYQGQFLLATTKSLRLWLYYWLSSIAFHLANLVSLWRHQSAVQANTITTCLLESNNLISLVFLLLLINWEDGFYSDSACLDTNVFPKLNPLLPMQPSTMSLSMSKRDLLISCSRE